jgi:hypothetical protein
MSKIGVDAHTYALMHSRTYAECLKHWRGDTREAKAMCAYYMRDWYVIEDGPELDQLSGLFLNGSVE